jgi:hypothetical protein
VYHLMGLGLSPGAVTGPLSYLAHCYQRWNAEDQEFFARSGEVEQRQRGERVGDVQAVVLFSTPEVLSGRIPAFVYVENLPGRISTTPVSERSAMKTALERLLPSVWAPLAGGRTHGELFWCEIDRRDIGATFNRVAQVVMALARVGGQGKEMWANLTGGNNVVNLALELAASLSGVVARLYYVQAENQDAEKCVRHTGEQGYWVDLPLMPLALSRVSQATLDLLESHGALGLSELHGRLCQHETYSGLVWNLSKEGLLENYLRPMWKQGLVFSRERTGPYSPGPQWRLVRPYQETLRLAAQDTRSLQQLAQDEPWLECTGLQLIR